MASYEAPPIPAVPPIPPFGLPPIAVTQDEAITLLRSQKIFKRALYAGWIEPVVQGGLGRASLFDYGDLLKVWARLKKKEFPPKLPSELKGIKKFIGGLLDFFEPPYIPPPLEEIEKAMATAFQKEQAKREAEALEEERKKFRKEDKNQLQEPEEPKTVIIEVDL